MWTVEPEPLIDDLAASAPCALNTPLTRVPSALVLQHFPVPPVNLAHPPAPARSSMGFDLIRSLVTVRSSLPDTPSRGGFA